MRKSARLGPGSPRPKTPPTPIANRLDAPVVGIGCSAGGLEALERFFAHVPADSALAFVVVQHLDPVRESRLPELISRHTALAVVEAADGISIKPGSVFVIPPNKDMSLLRGKLRLLEPVAPRGLRLPIDFFLRSLAEDRQNLSIGVVLSGMGSDGVFGLRAIKEKGGLTLAQEPTSAVAEGMPRSAIEAGVADIVAPAEQLPTRIMDYLQHPLHGVDRESADRSEILTALDKIIILLRDRSGNDFSLYKTSTLQRRIERRMAVHQIDTLDGYLHHLRTNPGEIDLLFKELLIGVTSFFRDPEVWEALRDEVLPALLAQHPGGRALRAWVAACSTGEEAYSLAIVFREALERCKLEARFVLQIYATDLDADAIETARKGLYRRNIEADVSAERLSRYFVPVQDDGYCVSKNIREMVVFATQNVLSDPPFTKLDLLTCRNLLIYFSGQLQKKVLPLFHYALNPGGILLLGSAETVGSYGHLFRSLHSRARLYTRSPKTHAVMELDFPGIRPPAIALPGILAENADIADLGTMTDHLIQQNFAPAAVLINSEGDILYVSGRTGKYLEPAAGKTNMNLYAMAREGLREALVGVPSRALKDPQHPIVIEHLRIEDHNGTHVVDVTVQALEKPEMLRGRVIIVFRDAPTPPMRRRSTRKGAPELLNPMVQELQQTRQALQIAREEMQTTVEELKSSNEELQSTNEELTTSREELQSLNEELQTVNAELQSKVDDLTLVRNDMANLLNSIEIATVFLDDDMKLRRFTTHATRLFKLIPGDVGRPLSDIVTDLDYPQLGSDVQGVLTTLIYRERQVKTHDDRWYRVRIMPYRTQDNVIDGVVITFIDITEIKQLEDALRKDKQERS